MQEGLYRFGEAIAADIDYIGAGTVEFIYDRQEKQIYFMEMNTRLQVEHPVSEMVTGVDIVQEQFRIAAGESIAKLNTTPKGYAMELRINAERLATGAEGGLTFAPSPGKITRMVLPEVANVRIIQAVEEGDEVPPYYDSLIVQIIAYGRTRNTVIKALREYLHQAVIEGVYTNLALMEAILDDPVFKEGDYDTRFLDGFVKRTDVKKLLKNSEKRNRSSSARINLKAIQIENSEELRVLSPRTGVFYQSPSMDDPPFVEIGDSFSVEQPLCLLEAMKVFENLSLADFNRHNGQELFPAGQKFTLTRVLAESGQTVNQGDLLFIVKPMAKSTAETAAETAVQEAG